VLKRHGFPFVYPGNIIIIPVSINPVSLYDFDQHVSEIFDRIESGMDDLIQIRNLIGQCRELRILEPFNKTGWAIWEYDGDFALVKREYRSGNLISLPDQDPLKALGLFQHSP